MHQLGTYIPQDRLRALIEGQTLPSRTSGAAIFADISGFTPLTEKLTQSLGPRKGVEALSQQLNAVYGALIDQVEKYGGSVISFAGDSIIGWFEGGDPSASLRAATCAQGMQTAMKQFSELSLKVVITTGEARRLIAGDPQIQQIDTLAGQTIARLATAERLTQKREILLDEATILALQGNASIREQRVDPGTSETFAVLSSLATPCTEQASIQLDINSLPVEDLRPWLLEPVYQRERDGMIPFLTDLRPAVPLFMNFSGIDYDQDAEAETKLSTFITNAQHIITRYDGVLLQLIIGDKGSYLYGVFGAFTAHEDDAQRAVYAALELKQLPQQLDFIQSIQTGISLGTLRVGAYGNGSRQTYAALGDDVNLAARLMTTAGTGEILITGRVQIDIADTFTLEPREPLAMKGKGEPQPVFAVTGISRQRATRLPEPVYRLPMIGRQEELALIDEKLKLALQGKGQVVGITAEAGMGKSRLIAEVIRLARKRGFIGYGGACQSAGTNTPYLVWQPIWQAFFDLDPEMPQRKQMRLLEGELEDRVPERVESLPLLGLVLNFPISDNEFTAALDPKDRKGALEALLEDCLRSAAKETPLLIVLEDLHWIDPLSLDLLETLVRVSENLPICFVLAFRPADQLRNPMQSIEKLSYFTKIELEYLTASDAELLIRAKLAQLFPERTGTLPKTLADQLTLKSQGNPFYIEELLNYVHDRGLNPYDANATRELELPASLQTLILSRIDQLTEQQKVTLKVASIIGRVFPFSWLYGYYPDLGDERAVKSHLNELSKLDLTPLDTPDPELAYLFKHIVTQEVAYESISFTTRSQLHELLARYLETRYQDNPPLDAITYHYSHSDNVDKKREYFRRSGEEAQAAYSNETALRYYEQALALSPDVEERLDLHINTGSIYHLIGDRQNAREHYQMALQLATNHQIRNKIVECEIKLGNVWMFQSDYTQALEWLEKAQQNAIEIQDLTGLSDALCEIGIIYWRVGNNEKATEYLQQGFNIAQQLNNKKKQAYALTVLATIKLDAGQHKESSDLFEVGLVLARESNDKRRIAGILNNYSNLYYYSGDYDRSMTLLEETLVAVREIGDKRSEALTLNNVGNNHYMKNDFATAQTYYKEALRLGQETEDRYVRYVALSSLGITLFRQGKLFEANLAYQESLTIGKEMNNKRDLSLLHCYFGLLALAQHEPESARTSFLEGLTMAQQADAKMYAIYNLIGMADLFSIEGKWPQAVVLLSAAAANTRSIGLKVEPELQEPYDKVIAGARQTLSQDDFQSAWLAGENMDLNDAVRFATEN